MVSDKVPGPLVLQQRISTKSESSEASKVFIKREEKSVWIDTRSDSRREPLSGVLLTVWTTFMGHFFWVSFGQSFWFADSGSILGIPQDPLKCAHTSLSQDGVYLKGIWVEHPLTLLTSLACKEAFCACVVREVSWLQEWEMCSGQGPAFSLNCSATHLGVSVNREWTSDSFTLVGVWGASASCLSWSQKIDDYDSQNIMLLSYHQPIRRMSMSWSHTLKPLSLTLL